jgi:hypothetical protein
MGKRQIVSLVTLSQKPARTNSHNTQKNCVAALDFAAVSAGALSRRAVKVCSFVTAGQAFQG